MRYYNIKKLFGLEPEEYEAIYARLFEEQDGRCAICRNPPRDPARRMPLDHCHETMTIRGLLCARCNRGIGGFSDRLDLLKSAVAYLEEYS